MAIEKAHELIDYLAAAVVQREKCAGEIKQEIVEHLVQNYQPDEIFCKDCLHEWAIANGYEEI